MRESGPEHAGIGARLRHLRTERGISIRSLASQAGFSPSFLSQLEADAVSPSIASLGKIAAALGVTLGQFFSGLDQPATAIVRREQRIVYTSEWSRSTVALLAGANPGQQLSAFEVVVEPGGRSGARPAAVSHPIFLFVTAGTLALTARDEPITLGPGDAAYLEEQVPFSWENRAEDRVTLLLVEAIGGIAGHNGLRQFWVGGQAAGGEGEA